MATAIRGAVIRAGCSTRIRTAAVAAASVNAGTYVYTHPNGTASICTSIFGDA
jgi:hypothetical protein